jgi:hypothetical protein
LLTIASPDQTSCKTIVVNALRRSKRRANTLIMIVIVRDVKRAVVLDTIPKRSRARASGQCDEDPGQSEVPVASQFGMPGLHSAQVDRRGHDLLLTSMRLPRWRAVDQHFLEF